MKRVRQIHARKPLKQTLSQSTMRRRGLKLSAWNVAENTHASWRPVSMIFRHQHTGPLFLSQTAVKHRYSPPTLLALCVQMVFPFTANSVSQRDERSNDSTTLIKKNNLRQLIVRVASQHPAAGNTVIIKPHGQDRIAHFFSSLRWHPHTRTQTVTAIQQAWNRSYQALTQYQVRKSHVNRANTQRHYRQQWIDILHRHTAAISSVYVSYTHRKRNSVLKTIKALYSKKEKRIFLAIHHWRFNSQNTLKHNDVYPAGIKTPIFALRKTARHDNTWPKNVTDVGVSGAGGIVPGQPEVRHLRRFNDVILHNRKRTKSLHEAVLLNRKTASPNHSRERLTVPIDIRYPSPAAQPVVQEKPAPLIEHVPEVEKIDIAKLSRDVMREMDKRQRIERERRGLL